MALHYHLAYILLFLSVSMAVGNTTSCVHDGERSSIYLDAAVDLIYKAKYFLPVCPEKATNSSTKIMDCADALRRNNRSSGVYTVWPKSRLTEDGSMQVYCDMQTDGGGWTVVQRRGNYNRPNDFFFKEWQSYKQGFGNIDEDFWIGNDRLFALTNQRLYSLRIDMTSVSGESRYAVYDSFWIDDENNKYRLHIQDYSGNAGDSMVQTHNNQNFTTKDQDNDNYIQNCAQSFKGGWWYNACHVSNLNGLYLKGKHETHADGVNWHTWKGYNESLEKTEMKIRPKKFRKDSDFKETPQ